jgi:cytochrome b subunit of formate dehydrogenase
MTYLAAHWVLITTGLGLIVNGLQLITPHFADKKGVQKVLLKIVELLSVVKSADTSNGVLKLPFTTTKKQ